MARWIKFKLPKVSKNMEPFGPVGTCDTTQLMVPYVTLQKQMRQSATSTYWGGTLVWNEQIDPLDDQRRTPPIAVPDPKWVTLPKPNDAWSGSYSSPTKPYKRPTRVGG